MTGKKYYWLKLKKDFFKRHDIQIIESMPNGKDYILFYLKLLTESVDHNGNLRFNDLVPYSESMLATITNTNVDIVKSAMKVFTELRMIEILDDQTIFMAEVEKLLGTESYWAEQKRKQRVIGQCPTNVQLLSNVSNQEIDIEIDKDIDIEKELNTSEAATSASVPYKQIMQHFNSICQKVSKIRGIEGTRKKAVAARWKANNDIEVFIALFKKTEESKFLNGENDRNWQVDFDWLMKPQNMTKVLEGRYDNKTATQSYKPRGKQEIVPEWLQEGYKQPETTLSSKTTTDIENELERLLKGEK